jgi:hydroxymethylbilane synthase
LELRIGTRGSALARWQAEHVKARLEALGHRVTLTIITTSGDRIQDRRLDTAGGKGAFLKEIEEAMLAREVDLAVHSLKDVPTTLPAGLGLVAFLERADPRDALLSSSGLGLGQLPAGAVVGTTSLRRQALVASLRPDLRLTDLRGNVDTRISRLQEGKYDAIILAMAGLVRLGRAAEVTEALDTRHFLPAPGQGTIAIECRVADTATVAALQALHHAPTGRRVAAERAFLDTFQGGCNVPLGAHAVEEGTGLALRTFVSSPDGARMLSADGRGDDAEELGRRVAGELIAKGARDLLA